MLLTAHIDIVNDGDPEQGRRRTGLLEFSRVGQPDLSTSIEHAGQRYESKIPETREAWFEGKTSIGLPFPNLPYLIDGNTKLTQSRAILHYLARKHCFAAKTEEETQKQDMVDGVLSDIGTTWFQLVYLSKDIERAKQE
ncbi:hypothetical protein RvY_16442 [Ramazzottius varieornatus]|uniref:glutathione transferase n=1 Tax=Ramazzottius varieornatus TaxID=947166 RepID=A0A1D1VYG3_RAMVA|nr:hypothetical protein RvY_16442 [Ramazzottius varieornatus]